MINNTGNKIRLFCFFALFVSSAYISYELRADDDVFRYPLTSQSTNTFNAVSVKLAENPVVKGNFIQEKKISRLDRSLVSSGNFIIINELGMVWETLKPFPSTMIMGKDFIMQSRPDGQKSVLSAQGNETFSQMADILSSVFSGNSRGLEKNFKIYFSGNVSNWSLGLLPTDSMIASFASKIIMTGDAAIKTIRIFEKNGDIITYTLSNHSYPKEANANEKALFKIP